MLLETFPHSDFIIYCQNILQTFFIVRGRRGRDRMESDYNYLYAISAYHHIRCEFESRSGEVYLIQHYVMKFVSDLRQAGGFLWVLRFHPSIKFTATI